MADERTLSPVDLILEKHIIDASIGTTATPYYHTLRAFEIKTLPLGSRILEVGSGGSDTVAHLLSAGYDAYALDPKYGDLEKLSSDIEQFLGFLMQQLHRDPATIEARIRAERQSLQVLRASQKNQPDHYKAASSTEIPFPEGYFDFVFSQRAITSILDASRNLFLKSFEECLRVTRPDGKVEVYPFLDPQQRLRNSSLMSPEQIQGLELRQGNQQALLDMLNKSHITHSVVDINALGGDQKKLVVTKGIDTPKLF
ncbi:MAG TPA: methyltransferase domain-containing protein [Candidatus Saccharimonadales bacterium]|nr:methyltransferase domain-containing protein [Candidatus Saccharimonadales bacterium]